MIAQQPKIMAELENAVVVHNASMQRFEIDADGQISLLEYKLKITDYF